MDQQSLWAPWRLEYVTNVDKDKSEACFLCEAWAKPDQAEQRLVVWRNDFGMILLNRYPYTNGHLLVAMKEHCPDLAAMDPTQRGALMELTAKAEQLLYAVLNPQGVNIGINVGRCAGAGLPGHLHVHLVPRWSGDTNFMSVVGQVRVIPQAMQTIHREMIEAVKKMDLFQ